jgi:hypothetical protein
VGAYPQPGQQGGAERKAAELRRLGVEDLFIVQDAGPNQFAISSASSRTNRPPAVISTCCVKRACAAQIASRGANVLRVEVRGPSDSLATLASDLSERLRGANRLECAHDIAAFCRRPDRRHRQRQERGRRSLRDGAAIVDTDQIAHQLTAPGGAAMEAIEAFGAGVVAADGALNRPAMRALAFEDPDARKRLEAILHPMIRAESERQCRAATRPT